MTTKITEKNISSLANIGVNWQSVVVADGSTGLTAVAGRGYFINTTSGTITVTLPTSPNVGDVIVLKDYARTWGTNNVTIASSVFDGGTQSLTFSTNGQTVTLVYMDNTKGFSLINEDTTTNLFPPTFISATGGTITTSGNFKIHTFTGDGSFVVATLGNAPSNPAGGPISVDYLVVGGGGGAGGSTNPGGGGGGGGAGGYRESFCATTSGPYTASPLATPTSLTVTTTTYPVTVGAGGSPKGPGAFVNGAGSNSVFSTITSAGGGDGGMNNPPGPRSFAVINNLGSPTTSAFMGGSGGSGGGAGFFSSSRGGKGNEPPVSPSQGNNGGDGAQAPQYSGGGGGGAAAGGSSGTPTVGGNGGSGVTSSISGSPTSYAGGGGGASSSSTDGTGGTGGGGNGTSPGGTGGAGSANTGGGGGAGGSGSCATGGAGGKGIVIIRYKFQ